MRAVCTRLSLLAIALAAVGSAACSSGPTALAEPAERLETLTAMDRRVGLVFDRLLTANVDLCPSTRLSAGWILHAAAPYSRALRPLAEARFGLQGDLPGILAVIPGGPAEQAGLAPGDLIVGLNGTALADGADAEKPYYEGFALNVARLAQALETGGSKVTILRAGQTLEAELAGRQTCNYAVQVDPGGALNAKADGRGVFISTAMVAQAQTEDELAMVLAHELAHNILEHHRDAATLGYLPWGGGKAERDADRLALYLLVHAGFKAEPAVEFFRRYGDAHWAARQPQWGHPSMTERHRALLLVADEISRQNASGSALRPFIQ